ncbi:MAG: DEAD/DEAH box helicase family protein [Candidatus Pacearchaeota archaeon]
MEEIKIKPREYQQKIFETCKENNCLVILPTGTGKTLIALMLAVERFKRFPTEKILFLAPTRPLIEQHLEYFKKNLPENFADIQLFTGKTPSNKRKEIWQTAEFIFSTPQCIANDLKNNLYSLEGVSLLIVDECHRCLKNYSYTFIANKYKEQTKNQRIIGLTASPGSEKQKIIEICNNLNIEKVEIRTRESLDVKPYLQELTFEKIKVDFPLEYEEIRQLLKEIFNDCIEELKNRKVFYSIPTKIELIKCQQRLFNLLKQEKNGNYLMALSCCSQAIKIQHALELLETQTFLSFTNYLKELKKQADEKKSRGVQKLVNDKRFIKAYTLSFNIDFEHPKLEKLIEIIKKTISENPNAKIIVFSQFRDSVKKISDSLNKIEGIKAKIFVGQAKKGEGKEQTGLNQKEQKKIIEEFSRGEINCLVATSIAEEGLDIPEVNEVIFYEPVPSAIRKIQRAGRTARLMKGSLKILITSNTRDVSFHYASRSREKKMYRLIEELKENFSKKTEEDIKSKQEKLF